MWKVMDIPVSKQTVFLERKNRFLGVVEGGIKVHVHDPGRLEELLYPGNEVLILHTPGKHRKTEWDLIAARAPEDGSWVLVHSGYHRRISERILEKMFSEADINPEVRLGESRIDFMIRGNGDIAVEVKGCTLARNEIALFPDAPTTRGTRHVHELIQFKKAGNEAMLLILIFRNARCFAPNSDTDPKFADAFRAAVNVGVRVAPVRLVYSPPGVYFVEELPLCER
ncbi:MAG: DNA/RNA nuclease SfsA [Euryarchaeota archaeon]|uniref:Sugar fermentation stimulation protein homolog n=1 Tax=uncultured euryarchaeote Alv-FOS4 TaxID=337893 RepID=Q3SA93_9EURY|nr:sugar fermentation stimulation protein [uncultured euryarchaeote Alv-FOS4]NPA75034.1 DNA/RNA nuclease SfsA [Euryarchaeota archaeon]